MKNLLSVAVSLILVSCGSSEHKTKSPNSAAATTIVTCDQYGNNCVTQTQRTCATVEQDALNLTHHIKHQDPIYTTMPPVVMPVSMPSVNPPVVVATPIVVPTPITQPTVLPPSVVVTDADCVP